MGAYKPLNWMNAPNRLVEEEGHWRVSNSKGEVLTVSFLEVISDISYEMGVDPGLQKTELKHIFKNCLLKILRFWEKDYV